MFLSYVLFLVYNQKPTFKGSYTAGLRRWLIPYEENVHLSTNTSPLRDWSTVSDEPFSSLLHFWHLVLLPTMLFPCFFKGSPQEAPPTSLWFVQKSSHILIASLSSTWSMRSIRSEDEYGGMLSWWFRGHLKLTVYSVSLANICTSGRSHNWKLQK